MRFAWTVDEPPATKDVGVAEIPRTSHGLYVTLPLTTLDDGLFVPQKLSVAVKLGIPSPGATGRMAPLVTSGMELL
jgi:hypothetical protein